MTAGDLRFLRYMLRSGWLAARHDRGTLIATCASFAALMLTTGFLLMHADFSAFMQNAPTSTQMIWYFIAVESILLAQTSFRGDIFSRVANGQIMFEMGYPRQLWQLHLPYMLGMGIYYVLVLSLFGLLWGYVITGGPPAVSPLWLWLPASMLCALGLYGLFTCFLVLAELRWELGSSFRLMLGKIFFLLGGIVVPPALFPGLLGTLVPLLPFAAFLYAGAAPHLAGSAGFQWWVLLLQPVWFFVLLAALRRFGRTTERKLQETGAA